MWDFIINGIFWVLALYGLFEIIKTIIYTYTYTNLKSGGIYFIIAVKNQEEKVEGFVRSILFRFLYGKEENIKDIIIADLDSTDGTSEILKRLGKEYDYLKIANWRECREIIDSIDKTK